MGERIRAGKWPRYRYIPLEEDHPWCQWAAKQHELRRRPKAWQIVETAQGETFQVAFAGSRYDWEKRYLTSSCGECPLYVGAERALKLLDSPLNRGVQVPNNLVGLCMVGASRRGLPIPKILTENPDRSPRSCNTSVDLRRQRITALRETSQPPGLSQLT